MELLPQIRNRPNFQIPAGLGRTIEEIGKMEYERDTDPNYDEDEPIKPFDEKSSKEFSRQLFRAMKGD